MFIKLSICTPEKTLFDGNVKRVRLPGKAGSFEVFYAHASIISTLNKGTITCQTADDQTRAFDIDKGLADVEENHVKVYLV